MTDAKELLNPQIAVCYACRDLVKRDRVFSFFLSLHPPTEEDYGVVDVYLCRSCVCTLHERGQVRRARI